MYNKVYLYVFSGTGNALAAARWFASECESKGVHCCLQNLVHDEEITMPSVEEKELLIGFFFPTHGFNAAPAMLHFITRFPRLCSVSVFLVNTRAGMKVSKLFLPGLSGAAQLLTALILRLKGFRIVGMQPLDLPSNWISLHPGLRQKVTASIFQRCEGIIRRFAERLLSGKTKYKALLSLPFDLAVVPVALIYYFFGRFLLAKTFISTAECNGCKLCEQNCPVGAIRMVNGRPYWGFSCESCMRCMNNCPERAIQTPHLYTFFWWYVLMAILPALGFWMKIDEAVHAFILLPWLASLIMTLFLWTVSIPVVGLVYRLLHHMGRLRWLDRSVFFTSLTSFSFWRRYKGMRTRQQNG